MSKVILREVPLAANQSIDNILSGSAFEFVSRPSIVSIGIIASGAGTLATIQAGGTSISEESPIITKTTPISIEDDMYYQFGAAPGDRLVVRARCGATARTVTVLVQMQPTA